VVYIFPLSVIVLTVFVDVPIDQYGFLWLQHNPFPMFNPVVSDSGGSVLFLFGRSGTWPSHYEISSI
jgi:hypothetical protein